MVVAALQRVRFGLSIATMAVTLRRAAYPMLPLAPRLATIKSNLVLREEAAADAVGYSR